MDTVTPGKETAGLRGVGLAGMMSRTDAAGLQTLWTTHMQTTQTEPGDWTRGGHALYLEDDLCKHVELHFQ